MENNTPPGGATVTTKVVAEQKVEPVVEVESKVEQLQKLTDAKNEPKEIVEDALVPSEDYLTSPIFYELTNYFGIPQAQWDEAKNELSLILDFIVKDIHSNDDDKILLRLRQLEDNLYTRPNEGEKRYKVMFRYCRLATKKASLTRAMAAYEKNPQLKNE